MSARKNQAAAEQPSDTGLNDEIVREYLKNNDDFLERNPDMMDYLHISHATGSAVSLVEKQVSVLRERNIDMRHRLKALTHNATENDKIFAQTRGLVLKLMEADSVESLYTTFMESMSADFGVEHASMILYGEQTDDQGYRIESPESVKGQIGSLFRGNKAICGTLRKEELMYLFPDSNGVGSAALMPLSADESLGLIAVGSSDANRYSDKIGMLFLSHIAEVMVKLLSRFDEPAH
jgi:uncharacterized protein YigA (DUF484 family)